MCRSYYFFLLSSCCVVAQYPNSWTSYNSQQYGGYSAPSAWPSGGADLQSEFLNIFAKDGTGYSDSCATTHIGDLSEIQRMCPKNEFFFGMNPSHIDAVQSAVRIINAPSSATEKLCLARQLRDSPEVNPNVWIRSFMSTVVHSPELSGLQRPLMAEVFPNMFVQSDVMDEVKRLARLPPNVRGDGCIVLDGSYGRRNGIENVLWYWREDVMLNAHHWYWHLANPFMPVIMPGQPPPTRPDRRGELFAYMHASLLARYNSERLSNGLSKVVPINLNYGTVIEEPYYSNLDGSTSGLRWTDRPPNTPLQDIYFNRIQDTPMNISIAERNQHLKRIQEGIDTGRFFMPNGNPVALNIENGIDFLAEVVESSIYSVNPDFYGRFGVHNAGHFIISLARDPRGSANLPPGVMADGSTAMRDPVFYRYHAPIAKIFDEHKHNLPAYHPVQGKFPLIWRGITIESVTVMPLNQKPNELTTYWNSASYDLSRGLDFNRSTEQGQGSVNVCLQHLDYEHFEYKISIKRDPTVTSRTASIRIFMAPRYDENGRLYPLSEQRTLFFVMDYFTVQLQPGRNLVTRNSVDSSLTIAWPQRLEELERDNRKQTPDCGCGFPEHLLLPKGRKEGMQFDLFVMATNGDEDAVAYQTPPPQQPQQSGKRQRPATCIPAPLYCGVPGQRYPDARPMGYPFDRLPYFVHEAIGTDRVGNVKYSHEPRRANSIQEYINEIPNTIVTQVRITHVEN